MVTQIPVVLVPEQPVWNPMGMFVAGLFTLYVAVKRRPVVGA